MAGFTSMALLGAGLLGGAVATRFATRNRGQQPDPNQPLAPGPTNAQPGSMAPPAPPIVDPAAANQQALGAARRQRKRTAAGSLLTNPVAPASNVASPPAAYPQRTLLGS